jgi:hypothetical protein
MRAQQQDFAVTHSLIAKGAPAARRRDRLILPASAAKDGSGNYPEGTRRFEVREILNPGEADAWTLYSVEEVIG